MCLLAKRLGLAPGGTEDRDGVAAFLGRAMSTPHKKSVTNALELLVDMGAMQRETNDLTDLGHCLSILSLEPRVGKMVIWSYLLGCSQVASNMAVAMSYKSPFVLPPPNMRRDAANAMIELSQNSESDQVTVVNAILRRDQLHRRQGDYNVFCRRNFLNGATLEMISELRQNLKRELSSLSFPDPLLTGPHQYHNRHDKDHALWQAAVAAGLYPNIASRRSGEVNFSTMSNQKAKIHISSVNAQKGQPLNAKCQVPKDEVEFVCFGELVKGTHFFTMSQTTHLASPLPLLLLCGASLSVHPDSQDDKFAILNVDDWIVFKADADTASYIAVLRKRLDSAFWRYISKPLAGINALTDVERDAIEVLGPVLQSAHKSAAAGR
jgi:ATP-dependent RNA helicase YTHDC2